MKQSLSQTLIIFMIIFHISLSAEINKVCQKPSAEMQAKLARITKDKSLILGKGGFGIVYQYDDLAIKIVRLNTAKLDMISNFLEEIISSKNLAVSDTTHQHVPKFDECYMLGTFVSQELEENFSPKTQADEKPTPKFGLPESFIYIAIVMEKLDKNLFWFLTNYSDGMDLVDRARMASTLSEHLQFINNQGLNHCDVKPDNFMLNRVFSRPKLNESLISSDSYFFNDFKTYASKIIDFGGVTSSDSNCKTYTTGFVPLDDVIHNGLSLYPKVSSSKNDVFAVASVLAHSISKDSSMDLLKMNMLIHSTLKAVMALENEYILSLIQKDAISFKANLKLLKTETVRANAIKVLLPEMALKLGDLLEPFKDTWAVLTGQTDLKNDDFIMQVFPDTENLLALLETIYTSYFITVKENRRETAKFEMMRYFTSSGLNFENYPSYIQDVNAYVHNEEKFVDTIKEMFTFSKEDRPDWDSLIKIFRSIEKDTNDLFLKINSQAKSVVQNFRGLNYKEYNSFMGKVRDQNIQLPDELQDHEMRILTKNNLHIPLDANPKVNLNTAEKMAGVHVVHITQDKILKAIQNNIQTRKSGNEFMKKRMLTEFDLQQFLQSNIQKQKGEIIRI